jgi:hypothetical protein
MIRRKQEPGCCTTIRVVVVTSKSLDLATGKTTTHSRHTEIGPCNVPLFGRDTCLGCASGWQVPDNRPATSDEITQYQDGQC